MSLRGRPVGSKGIKKISKGKGKLEVKCAVCDVIRQADLVRQHQLSLVLWDGDEKPAAENHPQIYETF